jgi:hypothetical protein
LPPPHSGPGTEITHVRASMLQGTRNFVEGMGGAPAWQDLLDQLSPEARRSFDHELGTFEWLETPHVNALLAAFEARYGLETAPARVGATVEQELKVAHPWLLSLLSPTTLLLHGATLFRFYLKGGGLEVERLESCFCLLVVRGSGLHATWFSHSLPAWILRALELVGGQAPAIRHVPPVEGCTHYYEVRWED